MSGWPCAGPTNPHLTESSPPMSPVELQRGPEVARTIRRLAHEIIESNGGAENLFLIGLLSRGAPLAERLAAAIEAFEGVSPPVGRLDVGLYRDDLAQRDPFPPIRPSDIPHSLDGATVVLVDDVLFTGAHDSRRDGRNHGFRTAGAYTPGRARRSRSPRAADSTRLRWPQHPDGAVADSRCAPGGDRRRGRHLPDGGSRPTW